MGTVSTIVPPGVLVQIALEPLGRHRMMSAADACLYERPKAFDGIRVDIAEDVDALRVVNAPMDVSELREPFVSGRFVAVNHRLGEYVLRHVAEKRERRIDLCANPSAPLDHTLNDDLVACPRSLLLGHVRSWLSADVGLVNLDRPAKVGHVFGQERADQVEHPPRRLVGHAKLAFELLGRDAAPRLSHEEDRPEPQPERRAGVLEDRPGHRVLVVSAAVAGVGRAGPNAVVRRDGIADFAEDAVRVQVAAQPFETRRVVREITLEIEDGVSLHRASLLPSSLLHGYNLA